MDTNEFKMIISESKNPEWFHKARISIAFPLLNIEETFIGLSSIHNFLSQQEKGWNSYNKIPGILEFSKEQFQVLKKKVENFLKVNKEKEIPDLERNWNTIKNQLNGNQKYYLYDAPETAFLIKINEDFPDSVNAAHQYFNSPNLSANTKSNFIGYLLAFEFDLKGKSGISARTEKEDESLQKMRKDLRRQMTQSENHTSEYLKVIVRKFEEYCSKIDSLKESKESLFNDWFEGKEDKLGVKESIETLKKTYQELLKLKAPADYWNERGKKLRRQGWIAFGALVLFILLVIWSLGELLWRSPEQIYLSFFGEDKSAAIRWSIIYITIISFMAFSIRAIAKVMFSSFHLARDSEERNTLTYFYLSLLNEGDIESEDRKLIMQSLFSRADTGLLRNESGPTMPNDIPSKFFGGS